MALSLARAYVAGEMAPCSDFVFCDVAFNEKSLNGSFQRLIDQFAKAAFANEFVRKGIDTAIERNRSFHGIGERGCASQRSCHRDVLLHVWVECIA